MKVLISDDDRAARVALEQSLTSWGYEVISTEDGAAALAHLQAPDAPKLAILDWMMPEMNGIDVCRRIREINTPEPPFLVLLSSRHQKEDVATGLESGANDYLVKPFHVRELQSRVRSGERVLQLQHDLATQAAALEQALAEKQALSKIVPICLSCGRLRDDRAYWQRLEDYLESHFGSKLCQDTCDHCGQVSAEQAEPAEVRA